MQHHDQRISRRKFMALGGSGLLTALAYPVWAQGSTSLIDFRREGPQLSLHFNENSLGMSPSAKNAATHALAHLGNRYADAGVARLKDKLAALHEVDVEQIILGNGSTEVIEGIVERAAKLGAKVIEPNPTFGDVRRYARIHGLEVISVPVGKGFVTDIAAMKEVAAKQTGPLLINICNPNNPTGTIVDSAVLSAWISNAPENVTFLIDEAYHDYAVLNKTYSSALPMIKKGKENVFITRTFSKIYGMAGMRVGYGIAAVATARETRPFATDYNLNVAGVSGAIASLEDKAYYQISQRSNAQAKTILLNCLDKLGLVHIESNTNFVLHKIPGEVAEYQRRMRDNRIKVGRRMTPQDGWNRISVGTPDEMQIFARTLETFRTRGWV